MGLGFPFSERNFQRERERARVEVEGPGNQPTYTRQMSRGICRKVDNTIYYYLKQEGEAVC